MVVNLNGNNDFHLSEIGGKSYSVNFLKKMGYNVPQSFVLSSCDVNKHLIFNNINIDYENLVDTYKRNKNKSKTELLKLKKSIENMELNVSFDSEKLNKIMVNGLAVRSSAIMEDDVNNSFAGCFESYFGATNLVSLKNLINKCIASAVSPRVISYIDCRDVKSNFSFSVLIQELIPSEKGGVCFTRNPLNINDENIYIEANWGNGLSVVTGDVDVDRYHVDKDNNIVSLSVGTKAYHFETEPSGLTKKQLTNSTSNTACLNSDEIRQLVNISKSLEENFSFPVDFEWLAYKSQIYVLQARPITT